ncbi:MAG: hypothetical protein ACLFTT_05235 [Candidatus Hydrogenedentota bacterium]
MDQPRNHAADNDLTKPARPVGTNMGTGNPEGGTGAGYADPPENAPDAPPADPVVDGLARSLGWLTPEQRTAVARLLMTGDGTIPE